MKFCPNCDNILIPRDRKLFCKVCNQEFELKPDYFYDYNIIHIIKHEEGQFIPKIVKGNSKIVQISNKLGKVHEDFFVNTAFSSD